MKKFSQKPAGILSSVDLKSAYGKTLYWLIFTILVICALFTLIPALWMVLTAFKSSQEIYNSAKFLPDGFSVSYARDRIVEAWKALDLGRSMINTFLVSVGMTVSKILVCGLAGYVLSKRRIKGMAYIFILVVWTMMMPGTVRTVSTYMSYLSFPFIIDDNINSITNINILNTYWPMYLGSAADTFTIVLFKNNFDNISTSLVESAKLDGCNDFGVFWKIMLPIAMPVVTFVAIGSMSAPWSDYFTPYLVLKDVKLMTTPAVLFISKGSHTITTNIYMMGLVFASIPTILIFIVFQKWIIGGIAVGGVKG